MEENENIKFKVRSKYSQISRGFEARGSVLNKLFEEDISTDQQKIDVYDCSDRETRADKLLTILFETSHPEAFIVFRKASQEEHGWIVDIIEGTDSNESEIADFTMRTTLWSFEVIMSHLYHYPTSK